MTDHKIASLGKFAAMQIDRLIPCGHSAFLEQGVARLHLALTYIDGVPVDDLLAHAREIADSLSRAFAVGANDISSPIASDAPFAFVISYPRCGNTVLMGTLARLLEAQVLEGFPHSPIPFSKAIYPRHYPLTRLVKDHVPRSEYKNDKAVILIRDGRDAMISLAHMTFKQSRHNYSRNGDLASFIKWLDREYEFQGWAKHMEQADELLRGSKKLLVRYEDFMISQEILTNAANFIDPDHGASNPIVREIFEARSSIFEKLGQNPHAKSAWGIGETFDPESLFSVWSQNRHVSHWKAAWDAAAKAAFHETGATKFLLKYGYETDPDWWRP